MCQWVGPHAPSFGRQLWGLPSCVEYLSPQGVLLPLVYGTTASLLWIELRGHFAWQATLSWTVYRLACHRLLPWRRWSPMQPGGARTSGLGVSLLPLAPWVGRVALVCWFFPVPRPPYVCAVSRASWLLFTGVLALFVVLCLWCPGPLGSCSPVRPLGEVCCVCGVPGALAPVHRCARWVCCVACAVSWATWLLFTGAPGRCVALRARCPGSLGSCSPVCLLCLLFCLCGVPGHLAPVHRCARAICCVVCAVSWATWLPFTGVPAGCVVLRVRRPGCRGSCSPVCPLGVLCCVCGILGHLAPVHRCARAVCCFACAVSWVTWLLFTGVPALSFVLFVRCPGPLGSCSPVCPRDSLCCVCGVLGHLAPVHQCARWVCCVACAVSRATWLLFTGAPARCVALPARCSGSLGFCSPVCLLCLLFCLCGVLGDLAPVHRCACAVCCVVCAVFWATWLLFTGVPARCVVSHVRCPGPLGPCSPVCPRDLLCCVCGVLGHLAPVRPGARLVCCFACAVSWVTWLLFTGVPALSFVLFVRCPGPLGSCSPVCPLGVLFCLCGVLCLLAPVHRCARPLCPVPLLSSVHARVRCPGPRGACSPVCALCAVRVCRWWLCPSSSPPNFLFFLFCHSF